MPVSRVSRWWLGIGALAALVAGVVVILTSNSDPAPFLIQESAGCSGTPADCPSRPSATAQADPDRITWTSATAPAGQLVNQYTVVYRDAADSAAATWAIFARRVSDTWGPTFQSVRLDDCSRTGNGWQCVQGAGFQSGTTYEFGVFARSDAGTLGGISEPFVGYLAP